MRWTVFILYLSIRFLYKINAQYVFIFESKLIQNSPRGLYGYHIFVLILYLLNDRRHWWNRIFILCIYLKSEQYKGGIFFFYIKQLRHLHNLLLAKCSSYTVLVHCTVQINAKPTVIDPLIPIELLNDVLSRRNHLSNTLCSASKLHGGAFYSEQLTASKFTVYPGNFQASVNSNQTNALHSSE